MQRRVLLAGLAAFVGQAAVPWPARAAGRTVSLTRAFPFLQSYYELAPRKRDKFHLVYFATLNRRFAPDLKAVVVTADGKRTPLAVGRDAHVDSLPSLAELRSDALMEFGASADDRVGLLVNIEPNVAVGPRMDSAGLKAALAQVQSNEMNAIGLLSFAVPKITSALFAGAGSAQAELDGGRTVALPVTRDRYWGVAPYYEPASLSGVRAITFARPPSHVFLVQHPR
ncbi:MAG TPA: hypothetical protein VKT30_00585 [Caulobacteraceae bacterium]|nr:hypothetical protein [Caulobacteraceae bacterium]